MVPEEQKILRCSACEGFAEWLSSAGGALAITTYQAGRLVLVGWDGRQVSVLPREFPKPMGLALDGDVLARLDGFSNVASLTANPYDGGCFVADTGNGRTVRISAAGVAAGVLEGFSAPWSVDLE